jgi:hypothetical protein
MALGPAHNAEGMKEFLEVQAAFVAAGLPVFHSLRDLARAVQRIIVWKNRSET